MPTIKEVAQAAGVSVSTASRALKNHPRISATTIERVQAVAKQIGYQPNLSAQALAQGEARSVGVIFPVTAATAPANPFHLDLVRGINMALQGVDRMMSVAICQSSDELLSNVIQMVERGNVRHFIVLYTAEHDPVIEYLSQHDLNFVVVGTPVDTTIRFIDNDNLAAAVAGVETLLQTAPIKRPLYIRSQANWPYEQAREAGFRQAINQLVVTGRVLALDPTTTPTEVNNLLTEYQPDALMSADDIELLSFYNLVAHQQMVRDLPTICFNNSRLIQLTGLPVRRIDLRPKEIGQAAVELLFDLTTNRRIVDFKIV